MENRYTTSRNKYILYDFVDRSDQRNKKGSPFLVVRKSGIIKLQDKLSKKRFDPNLLLGYQDSYCFHLSLWDICYYTLICLWGLEHFEEYLQS